MKKFSILPLFAAAAAIAVSCNKQEPTSTNPQTLATICVTATLTNGMPITKATESTGQMLTELLPSEPLTLTLTNTDTGQEFTCVTGRSAQVPAGTYRVTRYPTMPSNRIAYTADLYFLEYPDVYVDEELAVQMGVSSYSVTAHLACAAVLYSTTEISQVSLKPRVGTSELLMPHSDIGSGIRVFFVYGSSPSDALIHFATCPGWQDTFLPLNTSRPDDVNYVEPGNYYAFSPAAENVSGVFSFGMLDWADGGRLLL